MRVLVGRGGELAAPFGPIRDDTDCTCHHGLAGLDSRCPVEHITVAEHPDMTLGQLTAACSSFLASAGWDDEGGEIAAYMAADAANIAARFPVGTRLRASFDHAADDWTFTKQQNRCVEIRWDTIFFCFITRSTYLIYLKTLHCVKMVGQRLAGPVAIPKNGFAGANTVAALARNRIRDFRCFLGLFRQICSGATYPVRRQTHRRANRTGRAKTETGRDFASFRSRGSGRERLCAQSRPCLADDLFAGLPARPSLHHGVRD